MVFQFLHAGTLADRLFQSDLEPLTADAEPQAAIDADEVIGHPHEREPGDEIAAPVVEQKLETGCDEDRGRHVMAEAIFAGEQVEEFAGRETGAAFTTPDAVVVELTEQLFVRNGPGNRRDRQREYDKCHEVGAGDVDHAAIRRAARLRSLTSTRRTRSRAIVKYSVIPTPMASTTSRTTSNREPIAENAS